MTSRTSFSVRRAAFALGAFAAFALVPLATAHAQQTAAAPAPAALTAPAPPKLLTLNQNGLAQGVISVLMRDAGLPYIIGPGVTGDISVHISNLPIDTSLDHIAQSFSPPLVISRLNDGTYVIRAGETGPTRLALSTPPSTVTVQQARPQLPTAPQVSVSVANGDPVATALELQIIALRVDREIAAKYNYGSSNRELLALGVRLVALEKQLALHNAAKTASAKPIKTAQVLPQRAK